MSATKKFAVVEQESDDVDESTDYGTDGDTDELLPSKDKGVKICGRVVSSLSLIIICGVLFAGIITVALLISIALGLNDEMKAKQYTRGAVASDSGQCSEVGFEVLKKGSAVDAAIATLTCIGVVRMQSAGIGGGGFMLVRNESSGEMEVIDYREVAPATATQNMFQGNTNSMILGGKAVAVPGQMRGFALAHQRYGRLPWKDVITPSVKLAKNGFKLEKTTVQWASRLLSEIRKNEELKKILIDADGTLKKDGTVVKRPDIAATLQLIADHGADIVYNGSSVSHSIVNKIKSAGGNLTLADLANYEVKVRPAVSTVFENGRRYYTAPPPASGASVLSMLNILNGFGKLGDDVISYHRMVEAFKFAFAQRTRLGDPDFESSVDGEVTKIISLAEAARLRAMINDSRTYTIDYYQPSFDVQNIQGTTQVSIIRNKQEAVSVTETISRPFGAMLIASGIVLNNAMSDFSMPNTTSILKLPPSEVNYIKPGKRPLAASAPTIVIDESANNSHVVRAALGSGGGTAIPTTVLQVLIDLFDKGMTVSTALPKKRLHHQLVPNRVLVEAGFADDIVNGLRARGHTVEPSRGVLGHATAVWQTDTNMLQAASDRRNGGQASYGAL